MAVYLDPREAEDTAVAANDGYIPIESEKENKEPAEEKKNGTNGLLVSATRALIDSLSSE
jgi:hypothetical protein